MHSVAKPAAFVELEFSSRWGTSTMITLKILVILLFVALGDMRAQTVRSFEGIDASEVSHPELDIDPNGAIGTKQFMEWTNVYYQAYDKVTFKPVWSTPQVGTQPWQNNKMSNCYSITGDGIIIFDRLASRWVIAGHNSPGVNGSYYYCVAISNTDDLSSKSLAWRTYSFLLNPVLGVNSFGHVYFPDWPKLGTWGDGYYVSFDLEDVDNHYQGIGVVACALDRTNMLTGSTPRPIQCFSDPDPIPLNGVRYLRHSLIPGDVEGTTPPPSGRNEYFVSIQNPPIDGQTTTSNSINLWAFHVDWINPANSTFTNSAISVPIYTPGCYDVSSVGHTECVPEPAPGPHGGHHKIDSVGDRLMPRLAYRNFGTYESFLVSHTVEVVLGSNGPTGIRWYEFRGSGTPTLYQSGTISPGTGMFRFMPSIAQDHSGNAAVGYSVSSPSAHPGIRESSWSLTTNSQPVEVAIQKGAGDEENSEIWGDYTSMTVDPVDDCTFWYVNQYFSTNQIGTEIIWNTKLANFKLSACSR
jgi:hypothetical protein